MDSSTRALSPLQRDLLEALPEQAGVYLSGGAALSAFYLQHRQSYDLDFFASEVEWVSEMAQWLEEESRARGWDLESVRTTPGFRRFVIRRGDEETLLDIVHEPVPQEVPLEDKPRWRALRYDALDDLIANKLAALLGRGDPKDLVDLFFVEESGQDVIEHLAAAARKDAGLDAASLAWVLKSMPTDPNRLLLLRPLTEEQLARFRDDLVARVLRGAHPGAASSGPVT